MKKRNVKKLFILITCLMLLLLTFGCKKEEEVIKEEVIEETEEIDTIINYDTYANEIIENVIKLPEFSSLDSNYAYSFINNLTSYSLAEGTLIYKELIDETYDVARSYDSYLSNKPVYFYTINEMGYYRSFNLTYVSDLGEDIDNLRNFGLDKEFNKVVPFLAGDILNIEGFYIGANNRINEYDDNNNILFASTSTKSSAQDSVPLVSLPRYLADRCKNVNEALELVQNINIYSINDNGVNFNYAFTLADASGNYGVLEIANNNIYWHDQESVQTNFYLDENLYANQKYRNGLGRYEYINDNIDNITTYLELDNLITSITYSNIYNNEDYPYDIRTDLAGLHDDSSDYLLSDEKEEDLNDYFKYLNETYNSLTLEEVRNAGTYMGSIYTAIFDCRNKTVEIKFFNDASNNVSYVLE